MKACFNFFIIRIVHGLKREYCILDKKFTEAAFQEVLIYRYTVLHLSGEKRESAKEEHKSLLGSRWVRHRVVEDSFTRSRGSTAAITTAYLAHLTLQFCIVARCCLGMPFLHLLF